MCAVCLIQILISAVAVSNILANLTDGILKDSANLSFVLSLCGYVMAIILTITEYTWRRKRSALLTSYWFSVLLSNAIMVRTLTEQKRSIEIIVGAIIAALCLMVLEEVPFDGGVPMHSSVVHMQMDNTSTSSTETSVIENDSKVVGEPNNTPSKSSAINTDDHLKTTLHPSLQPEPIDMEAKCGPLGTLFYGWVWQLLVRNQKRAITDADIWRVRDDLDATLTYTRFAEIWETMLVNSKASGIPASGSMATALLKGYATDLILPIILATCGVVLEFSQPLLLSTFLRLFEVKPLDLRVAMWVVVTMIGVAFVGNLTKVWSDQTTSKVGYTV
jgi:hypothetical protein